MCDEGFWLLFVTFSTITPFRKVFPENEGKNKNKSLTVNFFYNFQPKYYGDSKARMLEVMQGINRLGCDFLVAGRKVDGAFKARHPEFSF